MAKDPHEEMERAAQARHQHDRERADRARADASRAVTEVGLAERKHHAAMIADALGGGPWATGLMIAGIVICLLGGVFAIAMLMPEGSGLGMFGVACGGAVVLLGVLVGVGLLLGAVFAAQRRRGVRRVGHGFDAERYLELLSQNRSSGVLVVGLGFAREPRDRRAMADAVVGWVPELFAEWVGETLRVSSTSLTTKECLRGKRGHSWVFSNTPIHMCFRRIVEKVVPKLEANTPIDRIDVEIRGDVLPWNAKP